MPRLSLIRLLLARSAITRGALILLASIVMIAGLPRWEVHAHAHGPDHEHSSVLGEHVDPNPQPESNEDRVFPHLHEVTTVSATIPPLTRIELQGLALNRWTLPLHAAGAPIAAGPPPHRPPIA